MKIKDDINNMENTCSMLNPFFESVVTSILFLLGDSDSWGARTS